MIKAIYNGFDDNTLTIINTTDKLEDGRTYDLNIVRSTEHFNYFWKCIQVLADERGYTPEEMKELLFIEVFNFTVITENKKTGKQYIKAESVANGISKKRLNEIMKAIELFYAEHGYIMPKMNKEQEEYFSNIK